MRVPTIVLVLALALAGCVTPDALDTAAVAPQIVLDISIPFELDHDHKDLGAHEGMVAGGFGLLSRFSSEETPGGTMGTTGEIDVQGDRLVQAALGTGFLLFDLADPAAPSFLSATKLMTPVYVADVKLSTDASLVFVGTQNARRDLNGVQIFSLKDPAKPTFVSATSVPGFGCHMLAYKEIAGGKWLFCAGNTNVVILEVRDVAGTLRAVPVSTYNFPMKAKVPQTTNPYGLIFGYLPNTHDMTVQDDPLTGKPIMLVSAWDAGVRIVDVADPRLPRELGVWAGEGAKAFDGGTHTAMATKIGEKRIVVISPENSKVPAISILDATDLSRIKLLAEWTAVSEYGEDETLFSTHNFQLVDGKMIMAQYHGGVWVIDMSSEERLTAPQVLGFVVPTDGVRATTGPFAKQSPAPSVWDVVLKDGHLYLSDVPTGLYAYEHPAFALGDAELTSFG